MDQSLLQIKFTPPKPTVLQSILDLLNLFANDFHDEDFKKTIKECFMSTATLPSATTDSFSDFKSIAEYGTIGVRLPPAGTMANPIEVDKTPDIEGTISADLIEIVMNAYIDDHSDSDSDEQSEIDDDDEAST